MNYSGKTRFHPEAKTTYGAYKDAAVNYVANLAAHERKGLREKPLDWAVGHPSYFTAIYQLLAALQLMKLPIGSHIIEVGSGAGWATEIMASLCYRLSCVEPAAEMIAVAKQRVREHLAHHGVEYLAENVAYHCSTIEECELPPRSADAAIFFESFHHVVDEHRTLKQVYDALRPGAWLVILGDANWIPGNGEQESAWVAEMERYGTLESPFTSDYLVWLLRRHGFTEVGRNHLVSCLVPIQRATEPAQNFALIDAGGVNLITARKPIAEDVAPHSLPVGDQASPLAPPVEAQTAILSPTETFAARMKDRAPAWCKPMLRSLRRRLHGS